MSINPLVLYLFAKVRHAPMDEAVYHYVAALEELGYTAYICCRGEPIKYDEPGEWVLSAIDEKLENDALAVAHGYPPGTYDENFTALIQLR